MVERDTETLLMDVGFVPIRVAQDLIHATTRVVSEGQYTMGVRFRYNVMELEPGYDYAIVYDKECRVIHVFRKPATISLADEEGR